MVTSSECSWPKRALCARVRLQALVFFFTWRLKGRSRGLSSRVPQRLKTLLQKTINNAQSIVCDLSQMVQPPLYLAFRMVQVVWATNDRQ